MHPNKRQQAPNVPYAYANHQVLYDENGVVEDLVVIDVNPAYEQLMGLKKRDVVGKKVSRAFPGVEKSDFDWFAFFGRLAREGGEEAFEEYLFPLKRWLKGYAYSSEAGYVAAFFVDVTPERLLAEASTKFLELSGEKPDYQYIVDTMKAITGASFVVFNEFEPDGKDFATMAIAGKMQFIRDASRVLGFQIEGKTWPHDPRREALIRDQKTTHFKGLGDLAGSVISRNIIQALELAFQIGTCSVVKTSAEDVMIGDFLLIYRKGHKPENQAKAELFADMVGMLIRKRQAESTTLRQKAELQHSEARMRAINESAHDAIVVLDRQGHVTLWNPAASEIFGYKETDIMGLPLQEFIFPNRHQEAFQNALQSISASDDDRVSGQTIELTGVHKNGAVLSIELSLSEMKQSDAWQCLCIMRDITERKQAEKALIEAREQAQVANEAKSAFLANMSHEIRTPLNAVIGFTGLMRNTKLDDLQRQHLDNAHESAHLLLGVISDILDLSKIESGKLELEPVKTDVVELAFKATDIVKYQASEKGLEMLLDLQPDLPRFAEVDPVRLKQVLVNILGNAVKFTEAGEVELKLAFTRENKSTGTYHFSVRDTGIGIDRSRQERLFEPFYQADSSTTRKYGGTGLGLQISSQLVGKMGGTLRVESEKGQGSTFSFDVQAPFSDKEQPRKQRISQARRALVVDDNAGNRMILEHTLSAWGISCKTAADGLTAAELVKKSRKPFDVAIVDYLMPAMDGLDTIRKIREEAGMPAERLPVILLHSSADVSRLHAESRGLDIHKKLIKPVHPDELKEALEHLHEKPERITRDADEDGPLTEVMTGDSHPVVLLVEDVQMNMQLMKQLMSNMLPDARLVEASNGLVALNLIRDGLQVDLIFMDVQMPMMDGLEATRRIRAHEKPLGKRTPIIALTADLVKGERETCAQAGMDGFLVKPLDPFLLRKILLQFLAKGQAGGSSDKRASIQFARGEAKDGREPDAPMGNGPGENQEDAEEDKKPFRTPRSSGFRDQPVLHIDFDDLMMRTELDKDAVVTLAGDALDNLSAYLSELDAAISEDDQQGMALVAHSIKGVAYNLSFAHLGKLVENFEFAIRNENVDARNLLKQIEKELENIAGILGDHE